MPYEFMQMHGESILINYFQINLVKNAIFTKHCSCNSNTQHFGRLNTIEVLSYIKCYYEENKLKHVTKKRANHKRAKIITAAETMSEATHSQRENKYIIACNRVSTRLCFNVEQEVSKQFKGHNESH